MKLQIQVKQDCIKLKQIKIPSASLAQGYNEETQIFSQVKRYLYVCKTRDQHQIIHN